MLIKSSSVCHALTTRTEVDAFVGRVFAQSEGPAPIHIVVMPGALRSDVHDHLVRVMQAPFERTERGPQPLLALVYSQRSMLKYSSGQYPHAKVVHVLPLTDDEYIRRLKMVSERSVSTYVSFQPRVGKTETIAAVMTRQGKNCRKIAFYDHVDRTRLVEDINKEPVEDKHAVIIKMGCLVNVTEVNNMLFQLVVFGTLSDGRYLGVIPRGASICFEVPCTINDTLRKQLPVCEAFVHESTTVKFNFGALEVQPSYNDPVQVRVAMPLHVVPFVPDLALRVMVYADNMSGSPSYLHLRLSIGVFARSGCGQMAQEA